MIKLLNSFKKTPLNKGFLFLVITPLLLLGYGFYLEYVEGLAPCPLCTVQRGQFILVSLFAMFAWFLYKFDFKKISGSILSISFISSLLGMITAGRHVWTQNLPEDKVPSCGPDLAFMMEAFPLQDVVTMLFTGDGTCAEVDWIFIGLSIPAWAFIWFFLLLIASGTMIHLLFNLRSRSVL